MKNILLVFLLCTTTVIFAGNNMNIYDFTVKDIDGKTVTLSKYKNKVLLIVNVASKCAFTGQYKDLENLYQKYKDTDFMILGFPSNEFSQQEPGTNQEIKSFCSLTYNVSFDMFSKINVNGENAIPLYNFIKNKQPGIFGTTSIKWNFTKFLVDKNGNVINRFGSMTNPMDIESDIKSLIQISN